MDSQTQGIGSCDVYEDWIWRSQEVISAHGDALRYALVNFDFKRVRAESNQ